MRSRFVVLLLCAAALAGLVLHPKPSRAVDFNISGSAQLDYFFVPFSGSDPRPARYLLDGFTHELSVKLAIDISSHISGNVKVCWGCHGFEAAMGFVDFRVADELNFRVGRFNPTFGEFQLRSDVANHRTSDRPLPYDMGRMLHIARFNRSVLPLPYVENGVEISGTHFFGRRVQLDYAVHAVTGLRANAPNPTDVDFIASRSLAPYYIDNNSIPSFGGRVGATFRLADRVELTLGASGIHGWYDPEARYSYSVLGADMFLRIFRTNLRAEYLLRRTEMATENNRFAGIVPGELEGMPLASQVFVKDGWYVELEQPLHRNVEMVLRWDGLHRVGNILDGSGLDFDAGIMRSTLGFNFIVARGYRLKLSGQHWMFWGMQNVPTDSNGFHHAFGAHFGAVAVF